MTYAPFVTAELPPADAVAESAPGGQSLGQAAEDPTASLMSVQLSDWYTLGFRGLDDDANTFVLRSAIPFQTGSLNHIFRIVHDVFRNHRPAFDDLVMVTACGLFNLRLDFRPQVA